MNAIKYLHQIFEETENLSTEALTSAGAPYLFRLFSFIVKEYSDLFSVQLGKGSLRTYYLKNDKKIIYRSDAVMYSCSRFVINSDSKLYIKSGAEDWRLFNFTDLKKLLLNIYKNVKNLKEKSDFDVSKQLNKAIQQTKYFICISRCVKTAKKQLIKYSSGRNPIKVLLFNPQKRLGAFLLAEAFGVTFGHLDHPTPYPYSNNLQQNLLGGDPFLSFYRVLDETLRYYDNELVKLSKKFFTTKAKPPFSFNGIKLTLVPKYYFPACDLMLLNNLSHTLCETAEFVHNVKIKYDHNQYFLLFIPMIESDFVTNATSCLLPKDCSVLPYSLLGFSTSSGRSLIMPVISKGTDQCIYIKTSWPDIIKTAQNRALSPSRLQWFKICNEIYKSFSSKYIEFQFEQQFCPNNNADDNVSKYLSFLLRDFSVLKRDKNEVILPLIGIIVPNHPYPIDTNPLLYLIRMSKKPELFVKQLISCVTDVIIHQLLNKGVFHSLHLQNCSILFKKNKNIILPKRAILRDGDIRMCCDYSSMLNSREISLINLLKKKRGKFVSKARFYKQLFHNIINENFGNIERCLVVDKRFTSDWFWDLVCSCFKESLSREVNELKIKNKYKRIHKQIVVDFEKKIFCGNGYAVNFFQMGFFGVKENFVKVENPLKNRL